MVKPTNRSLMKVYALINISATRKEEVATIRVKFPAKVPVSSA